MSGPKMNIIKSGLLNCPLDQTGAQTTSTDFHPLLDATTEINVNDLQIYQPTTPGFAIGMTNLIPGYRTSSTTITHTRHGKLPPLKYKTARVF